MNINLPQAKTLQEISKIVSAKLIPNTTNNTKILNIATIESATSGSITFLANPKYKQYLSNTRASAIILEEEYAFSSPIPTLITKNSRLSLARLLQLCEQKPSHASIHPSAVIDSKVKIGNNVQINSGVVIGKDCEIGDNCILHSNVILYSNVCLGEKCIIHSGTVIGSDGFGYAIDEKNQWVKLPHFGGVRIGDNVEIGSNTSIDQGVLEATFIDNNVIIDNLVQIAHNVSIGEFTAIAGCVGIAGSTSIGKRCLIGGGACIGGHIEICDDVNITGTTAVNSSIMKSGIYSSGLPARENHKWKRNVAHFMSLDRTSKRIRKLEKSINIEL